MRRKSFLPPFLSRDHGQNVLFNPRSGCLEDSASDSSLAWIDMPKVTTRPAKAPTHPS